MHFKLNSIIRKTIYSYYDEYGIIPYHWKFCIR